MYACIGYKTLRRRLIFRCGFCHNLRLPPSEGQGIGGLGKHTAVLGSICTLLNLLFSSILLPFCIVSVEPYAARCSINGERVAEPRGRRTQFSALHTVTEWQGQRHLERKFS